MNFYKELGVLIFGTWLKRLSSQFHQDVLRIYAHHGIKFELSWFPVFYLLNTKKEISITEVAKEIEVSHPAIIQVVNSLEKEELVFSIQDKNDLRRKCIRFTKKGQQMMNTLEPIWENMKEAMKEILSEGELTPSFLDALCELESISRKEGLYERYKKQTI